MQIHSASATRLLSQQEAMLDFGGGALIVALSAQERLLRKKPRMTYVLKLVFGTIMLAMSPVVAAALDCHPEAFGTATMQQARSCILNGANIEARGVEDAAPLHFAAATGNTHAVRVLIAAGANLEARNMSGLTPLHTAAIFDMTEAVEVLIKGGADTDAQADAGATPLHFAAVYGEGRGIAGRSVISPTIQALIEGGANVNALDRAGATPLTWALRTGNEIAEYMLSKAGGN